MDSLSESDYNMMKEAAENIIDREDEDGDFFIKERYARGGFLKLAVVLNWEELYTYLAQGELTDEVEEALKNDFPLAYKLYQEIKEKCKLK